MTGMLEEESKFLSAVGQFEIIASSTKASQDQLDEWRNGLETTLRLDAPASGGLKKGSGLAKQVSAVRGAVEKSILDWSSQWEARAPARELADQFGDKAVLLVFGKVNAGKSSFCNFLVDRFIANGKKAQYFYLKGGKIEETSDRFVEGVTETTARIQGVFLDKDLVLLDTPGLHSVTEENGALTKRFTDSADAVLWLTSSASPGQVQELSELSLELRSGKPLLPVITKSDSVDSDEVDGEIVRVLLNKSAENRQLQESDVNQRTLIKLGQEKLNAGLLRAPLSVSAHKARENGSNPDVLATAGFARLYEALTNIVGEALVYKQGKAERMFLTHLDRDVLGALNEQVVPQLDNLMRDSKDAQATLDQSKPQIASAVVREVLAALPGVLQKHEASRDVEAVSQSVSSVIHASLANEIKGSLAAYVVKVDKSLTRLATQAEFEDRAVEVETRKGAAARAATAGVSGFAGGAVGAKGGAIAGAALGSVVPIVGTAAGATAGFFIGLLAGSSLGAWFGDKGGELFESTEIERRVVGISYEKLQAALEADVRKKLPELAGHVIESCRASIERIETDAERLKGIIQQHERALESIKTRVTR